ncbi:MAG: DUF1844 domain-containing protein [Nitrospirae bacterium]|nr:DUF1844 domain-containing protein [Nitrospirota bacterium]
MGAEEDQGFVVRDKRRQSTEATSEPSAPTPESKPADSQPSAPSDPPTHNHQEEHPPVSFSSFIFSLGSSALMLMGEPMAPDVPPQPANLPQSKEIIDILNMLEEKTRGNLSDEEATVVRDMLYALRMKYVDLVSGKSG